jgi:basic amino acid/polyamine antiporter, APA family
MTELKRALSLPVLIFYGVGMILGAGIYSVIGAGAAKAGESLWMSFVLSGLVALPTALSYAELTTTYPSAGAEYAFVQRAMPAQRWVPFTTGLIVALSGAATAATVALAFASYLAAFVALPPAAVALALLALASAVNIIGIQYSSWANVVFTLIEVGGLLLFIAVGVSSERLGEALLVPPHAGVLGGAAIVFFAFLGFEHIANLAEEAKEPARDLPRAILICLGIAMALYFLVALSAVSLAPPDVLAKSDAPLAEAAGKASSRVAAALGGVALFATANTALIALLGASRVIYRMAKDGDLPKALGRVLSKRKTPWLGSIAALTAAAALLPLGGIAVVASVSSFVSLVAFISVNIALIVLRYRDPERKRPFRVPLALGRLPVLPALGAASSLLLLTQLEPLAIGVSVLALGGILGLYLILRKRLRKRPPEAPPSTERARLFASGVGVDCD